MHEQGAKQAVRQCKWKAVKLEVFKSDQPILELYDLSIDPGETKNLAAEFPEKLEELENLMNESHRQNPQFSFYRSEKEGQ